MHEEGTTEREPLCREMEGLDQSKQAIAGSSASHATTIGVEGRDGAAMMEADLGVDCWMHVLSFLGPRDLTNVGLVSRRLLALVQTPTVWKDMCARPEWSCLPCGGRQTLSPDPYPSWCDRFKHLAGLRWSEEAKGRGIAISGDRHQIVNFPRHDAIVAASRSFTGNQRHYWEIKVTTFNLLRLGVMEKPIPSYERDLWQEGWAIVSGAVYVKGVHRDLRFHVRRYVEGSVVGFFLDMGKRTVEYYHNGENLGVTFDNLPDEVFSSCE